MVNDLLHLFPQFLGHNGFMVIRQEKLIGSAVVLHGFMRKNIDGDRLLHQDITGVLFICKYGLYTCVCPLQTTQRRSVFFDDCSTVTAPFTIYVSWVIGAVASIVFTRAVRCTLNSLFRW